jgi:hypothetical protein
VAGCACIGGGGSDHAARTGGAEVRGDDCCLLEWDLRVARLGHSFVGLSHLTCICWVYWQAGLLFVGTKIWNAARDVYGTPRLKNGINEKGRNRTLTDFLPIPNLISRFRFRFRFCPQIRKRSG